MEIYKNTRSGHITHAVSYHVLSDMYMLLKYLTVPARIVVSLHCGPNSGVHMNNNNYLMANT